MITKFIEATQGRERGFNWGKFMIGRFTEDEWDHRSEVDPGVSLLAAVGTNPQCVWVLDLQTHEGASFRPGGLVSADLDKHKVWVCPMFEPFLEWLYDQDLTDLDALPSLVELPDAPAAMFGYRRGGPEE